MLDDKACEWREGDKDKGVVDWIIIASPDELFKYNINVDFEKLDFKSLLVNVASVIDDE